MKRMFAGCVSSVMILRAGNSLGGKSTGTIRNIIWVKEQFDFACEILKEI